MLPDIYSTFVHVLCGNLIVSKGSLYGYLFELDLRNLLYVIQLTYAGNLSTLEPVMKNSNFRFVQADICDREAVDKLFEEERPNIVVNFAAESHVDHSIENSGIFLQTNIIGAATLLDASRKYGIKRYHQISTDEVYGDLTLSAENKIFIEETSIRPSSLLCI